ncbi:MAG: pyridoxamine 5'-phosphate oxidase family protein [Methanobrevibacter sp.]|uniref:pyridoxamine 5'-phosphate oxidase family protein n=1 Tax=Methanobrevibacter sp. TaxID=66852 RepID=UPI00257F5C7B|nr:pyridoxamine 5'-phosphate oxidase family protein [Methanobrevibacter sp.]MBR2664924.1 pyridoxamine 5'-phosphate oxidase family protein [Methanobrevibacter sp.]MBR3198301.1 pyridoxamine 5'-phosphate oxidase family protein [Methanobrevibacter sp.]MBR7051322.1 pyridoxamine 5'-phosphate oxidase family protein [Methanobrevibacter sp.]
MFRKMRRLGQMLSKEECEEILTREPRGVLALLGDYDYPYALPMSHVYVDGKIYFHGAMQGHKNDAVKKHDKVSYCVFDEGVKNDDGWSYTFRSVIVFGRIRTLADDDEKVEKLTHLGDKFFPTHDETVSEIERLLHRTEVFEITIEHMSGKTVVEK